MYCFLNYLTAIIGRLLAVDTIWPEGQNETTDPARNFALQRHKIKVLKFFKVCCVVASLFVPSTNTSVEEK